MGSLMKEFISYGKIIYKKNQNFMSWIFLAVIIMYPFLHVNVGIDVTDTGTSDGRRMGSVCNLSGQSDRLIICDASLRKYNAWHEHLYFCNCEPERCYGIYFLKEKNTNMDYLPWYFHGRKSLLVSNHHFI